MRKSRWATLLTVLALSGVAARGAAQPLDLNGDGREDILLQMPLTPDAVGAWLMGANGQPATFTTLPSPADWSIPVPECSGNQLTTVTDRGPWRVIGSTDYNRDGIPDLVFAGSLNTAVVALRTSTGAVSSVATLYAPTVTTSGGSLPRCTMDYYTAVATADLDGDGVNDLVLQTRRDVGASGDVVVRFATGATSPVAPAGDWRVVGSTDLNGDGIPDLLLQYPGSGYVGGWVMNRAGSPTQFVPVAWFDTGGWLVAGTADLNGDGVQDVLLQHPSGWAGAWTMSRTGSPSGFTFLSTAPITPWTLDGVRSVPEPKPRLDFNADGREDIPLMYPGVPRYTQLAALLIGPGDTPQSFASIVDTSGWEMVYSTCPDPFTSHSTARGPWRFVGVLDQNQDGITDLVFSEPRTGNTVVLLRDSDGRPARLDVIREMRLTVSFEPAHCFSTSADVVALADIDGDGRDDLVIQAGTLDTPYVTINYATGSETVVAGTYGMGGWRVAAVMDLNGDTIPDLVLQDTQAPEWMVGIDSGQVAALLLNRAGDATEFREITGASNGGWWVAGTVDVNADGIPDLMLQQLTLGAEGLRGRSIGVWLMNGAGQPTTFRLIEAIGGWTVFGWVWP